MGENESLNQALIDCVKAAGGSKQVGHKLWPEKTMEAAQRHLLACLDENKPERLSPEHLLMLLRLARERGHHDAMNYILADLSYAPCQPVEPHDEAGELMREYIAAVADSKKHADRMERIAQRLSMGNVRAVA